MKTALFILGMFLCVTAFCYSKSQRKEADYLKLVLRLQNQHGREMRAEGYYLGGTGGELCHNVEKIYVRFYANKELTIDEARKDYVKGVERFLKLINGDESIRPYLHHYPFGIEDLEYNMSFMESSVDTSGIAPIAYLFCYRGILDYSVYDPSIKNDNPLRTVHSEPYLEALRIVREAGLLPDDVIQH